MATRWLSATNRIYRVVAMSYASTTITPNANTTDIGTVTLNTATTTMAAPSGTATNGQRLSFRFTQDGSGGRVISWDGAYTFNGGDDPTLSTAAASVDKIAFEYNSATSKWECIGVQIDDAPAPGQFVGREVSTSDSTTFTTSATRIQSVSCAAKAGHTYLVSGYGELVSNGSAGAFTVESYLRYTTNGTEATTSDTAFARAESRNDSTAGVPRTVLIQGFIDITSDCTFWAALCSQRVEGSVTCQWTAGSGRPRYLTIQDVGPTISDSGNSY